MSRVTQSGLQSRFVELSHYFSVNSSLVKNFGAVVLDDPDRLTAILQLSPPPCLSDERVFHLLSVQAQNYWSRLLVRSWPGCEGAKRHVDFRWRRQGFGTETLPSVCHFRRTLVDPECLCFVVCYGSPNQ